MNIHVDKAKLDAMAKKRGYRLYDDIAAAAKARSIELSRRTIYNIANNQNWQRDSLLALCRVLECRLEDFVEFTNGDKVGSDLNTHGLPQPVKADQQIPEPA